MRPVIVAWLIRHGFPAWLAPEYATMVGIASLLGGWLALRMAEKDGKRVHLQARAFICAYFAALLGGYVFEWIRMIPVAIERHSFAPIMFAGRAAYGGLIFSILASVLYLRHKKETVVDFLDRATMGLGITFACVRFGCFLEGCDFGRPTASIFGVRFPAGSEAADTHFAAGWIPAGAPSLPVHATELYESGVGILATLLALIPLRKGRRDGTAFLTWMITYAAGRFLVETLRGDMSRGRYVTLSTAQWVSLAILAGAMFMIVKRLRPLVVATASLIVLLLAPRAAYAQQGLPPPTSQPLPTQPPPLPTTPPPLPADQQPQQPQQQPQQNVVVVPAPTDQVAVEIPASTRRQRDKKEESTEEEPKKDYLVTGRISAMPSLTWARDDIPSGWAVEFDAMFRLRLGKKTRIDLGLEGRRYENNDTVNISAGVIGEFAFELHRHVETLVTFVPHHTWFNFKEPYWQDTNAYGLRYGLGVQFPFNHILFGATPIAFTSTSSTQVGVITQWEPKAWFGVSF